MCITDTLDLEYTGSLNPESISWIFNDGIGSGLLTNQKVTFLSSGLKTIFLQVIKDDCTSETFSSTVFVEPELDPVIVQCDTVGTNFVTFSWNTITNVPLYELQIDNDPSFFTSLNTITIDNLDEEQEVSISVTTLSSSTCPGSTSSSLCTTTKTPVAVEDQSISQVSIYPNPVTENLFFEGVKGLNLSYSLYNIVGEKVENGTVNTQALSLSTVHAGIYVLRVIDPKNGQYKEFKVIKK
jgi:hypothetical protein